MVGFEPTPVHGLTARSSSVELHPPWLGGTRTRNLRRQTPAPAHVGPQAKNELDRWELNPRPLGYQPSATYQPSSCPIRNTIRDGWDRRESNPLRYDDDLTPPFKRRRHDLSQI